MCFHLSLVFSLSTRRPGHLIYVPYLDLFLSPYAQVTWPTSMPFTETRSRTETSTTCPPQPYLIYILLSLYAQASWSTSAPSTETRSATIIYTTCGRPSPPGIICIYCFLYVHRPPGRLPRILPEHAGLQEPPQPAPPHGIICIYGISIVSFVCVCISHIIQLTPQEFFMCTGLLADFRAFYRNTLAYKNIHNLRPGAEARVLGEAPPSFEPTININSRRLAEARAEVLQRADPTGK